MSNITTTINIDDPVGGHQRSQRLIVLATNVSKDLDNVAIFAKETFFTLVNEKLQCLQKETSFEHACIITHCNVLWEVIANIYHVYIWLARVATQLITDSHT